MNCQVVDSFQTPLGVIEMSIHSDSPVSLHSAEKEDQYVVQHCHLPFHQVKLIRFHQNGYTYQNKEICGHTVWMCEITRTGSGAEVLTLSCQLRSSIPLNTAIATGENIECIEIWDTEKASMLHIATEDGESIRRRAEEGLGFPKRFASLYSIENPLTAYLAYGFSSAIPRLQQHEKIRLYYTTANTTYGSEASWLAVDINVPAIEALLAPIT